MPSAERVEAESSPPLQRRSTASKVLFGCGVCCGVMALLCCGGFAILGGIGYFEAKQAVDYDPASVRAMTTELATVDIPAGLEPKLAINAKIPFVGKTVFKAAVYTDGRESKDRQLFYVGEVAGNFNVDQNKLRYEVHRALERPVEWGDDFETKKSHMLELQIRDKPATFFLEEGELRDSHKKMIRVMGQFEGHEGAALLFLQLDAEQHNVEQVEQLLRSIR